jgi:predicted aspartyl protease
MFLRHFIWLSLLFSLFYSPSVQAKPTPILFERISGLIVVQAKVNQGASATFIVDTGASITLVSQAFVRERQLKSISRQVQLSVVGSNKAQAVTLVQLDRFALGNVVINNQQAIVQNLDAIEHLLKRPLAGVIGASFLQRYRVVIDYPHRILLLQ